MTKHDERLLDGEEDEEYLEDYHYQDWGVDRVDLDFKSVADLQSLLSDRRRGQLSYNLYKLYDKIDASLRQDLRSVTLKPGPSDSDALGSSLLTTQSSQHITTRSITDGGDTVQTVSTSLNNLLSSTDSLQNQERERLSIEDSRPGDDFGLLSSYLSSTEPSLLPSMPTEESDSSSFGSVLINFAFIIIFILVSIFIVIQCSHFVVYIARQAFKNRNSGRKLPEFLRSRLTTDTEVVQDYTMNERVRGLVVEVDCNNHVSAHTAADPGSPVSVLHNSPFYSPVKQTPGALSPAASSNRSTPFMEAIIGNVCSDDPDGEMDSINQDDPQEVTNDSDEGIESEEGDEDIDGEAFKQLIRENVPEQRVFSKTPLLYSNCFSKEEIYGKFSPPGLTDNCHFQSGERGNSVESPSCDISGLSSFSSVSPPSPLLVTRWSREHGHLIPHIPATGGVGECLI